MFCPPEPDRRLAALLLVLTALTPARSSAAGMATRAPSPWHPRLTVVIAPGHNPTPEGERGALSARGAREVELNDGLATRLKDALAGSPRIRPLLSRGPDERLTLQERLARLRVLDADLVVSLHHDSVHPSLLSEWTVDGVSRRYCDEHEGFSLFVPANGFYAELSQMAARSIADSLLGAGRKPSGYHALDVPGERRKLLDASRAVYEGDWLFLLRSLERPIVLVEQGFLVHRAEESRLRDPAVVDEQAKLLAQGILRWAEGLESDRLAREPEPPRVGDDAIRFPEGAPSSPVLRWVEASPGLDAAVLPLYFRGRYVDRVVFVRASPDRFRVSVHHDAANPRTAKDWREHLGAAVTVNSSFYTMEFEPQTPILAGGTVKGPRGYRSKHGAFLAEPAHGRAPTFTVRDLKGEPVDLPSTGYREGVVSYPTLVDFQGKVRARPNPGWRADRSFIGTDRSGRVVVGTTEGGFFSLHRLGVFLKALPGLDLTYALNLDGGPPACLSLKAGSLSYEAWGRWESNDSSGQEVIYWGPEEVRWPLPAVIALSRRE